MAVLLVVTEHSTFLTPERRRHYESIRARLEHVAGRTVDAAHYESVDDLRDVEAVVLSGSRAPWSVHDPRALDRLGASVRGFAGPVLGICAGMQLQVMFAGGAVRTVRPTAEWKYRIVDVVSPSSLFDGIPSRAAFSERHTDEVVAVPPAFRVLATSPECRVEAIADRERRWWGTQFHPERFDDDHPAGERVLRNFFELAAVRP